MLFWIVSSSGTACCFYDKFIDELSAIRIKRELLIHLFPFTKQICGCALLMLWGCYCFLSITLQSKQFCCFYFFRNDRLNTPHAKAFNLVFICLFISVWCPERFTGERCFQISFGYKVKLFYDHWRLLKVFLSEKHHMNRNYGNKVLV